MEQAASGGAREAEDVPAGYKRTEAGVIPEDWDSRPLGDDVSLLSGHHVLARYCNDQDIGTPYLTGPADFPNGRIKQKSHTIRPTTLCAAGDILVTVKGSGSGTLVEADAEYCISRQLMAIRPATWNRRFLYCSLLQNASRIRAASTGLIPGLSRADILDQQLPIPRDSTEQRAIAEALSDVDGLLEALDALISKKRAVKQATMQQLLTGKTRLPGFSGEWEPKRLRDLGCFSKGHGIRRDELSDDGRPCVRYGELYTRYDTFIRKSFSTGPCRCCSIDASYSFRRLVVRGVRRNGGGNRQMCRIPRRGDSICWWRYHRPGSTGRQLAFSGVPDE